MSHGGAQTDSIVETRSVLEEQDGLYAVKLPIFEGPLDLLLHLIRQNEVDIKDIQIARIGEQYLEYIEFMRELNIDIAAEFLTMAATLALIKSRMLLPSEESEDEGDSLDPRAELVARLLDYKRFKEAAEALAQKRWLDRDIYKVNAPGVDRLPESEREIEVGLFDLIEAFRTVLEGAGSSPEVHEVDAEPVTVRDRMLLVMELLERRESLEFSEVFHLEQEGPPHRSILIATFLAILELARLEAVRLFQGTNEDGAPEGPIRLRANELRGDGPDWRERISMTS